MMKQFLKKNFQKEEVYTCQICNKKIERLDVFTRHLKSPCAVKTESVLALLTLIEETICNQQD